LNAGTAAASKGGLARIWTLRALRRAVHRPLMSLRRGYYADGAGSRLLDRLPQDVRARVGVDDERARFTRRIEVGAGPYPQSGYLHVDVDANARHLEARALAWELPFDDDWAEEILSVHAVEHIAPRLLDATLREWRRVLAPGGTARIHVPNAPALMKAYLAAETPREKWILSSAILGMYCGPDLEGPEGVKVPSDHQILFDPPLLMGALEHAGFIDVVDLTERITDRHTDPWKGIVDRYSIIVEGRKPPSNAGP
jgi:SAM-dependent methyltransferase